MPLSVKLFAMTFVPLLNQNRAFTPLAIVTVPVPPRVAKAAVPVPEMSRLPAPVTVPEKLAFSALIDSVESVPVVRTMLASELRLEPVTASVPPPM